jgi:predicted NAD-dependent protein-ADP-ribosyltransferase YbiA (DUF1768 family)
MKDIKRTYEIENSIYFNSKYGEKVLSNMYPCKLVHDGEVYNSVEQMFHALLYKMLLEKNMECKNAFECKEMYKTYVLEKKESKLWGETSDDVKKRERQRLMEEYRIIHKCHQVKFQQFKPFRDIIINSGDKDIVEWCYWLQNKEFDTFGTYKDEEKGIFSGGNICGRSMMECRKEYREGKLKIEEEVESKALSS